ncbi:MAG: LUD domain-containing protein [Phycisphaerales bacterium]|nr:LUD domain-containing protein [Phycisphaerales bacterium]
MNDAPFPGTDRASFIARVSARLGRGPAAIPPAPTPTPTPNADQSTVRLIAPDADLTATFAARAAAAGMIVHRATALSAANRVLRLLNELGVRRIAVADVPFLKEITVRLGGPEYAAQGIELVPWRDGPGLDPLYSADAGITDVQVAIAETGTLLCASGPGRGRGLSLVPPVHIAIVRESDVIADLVDFRPDPAALPSSLVLITGPSKTADIEGILITGVHGPRAVHIVLIDDL